MEHLPSPNYAENDAETVILTLLLSRAPYLKVAKFNFCKSNKERQRHFNFYHELLYSILYL